RLSNLLAAVGRGQLRVLADRVAARRQVRDHYQKALSDLPGLVFMPYATYGEPNGWLTCFTIDPSKFGATREDIRLALEAENIEARPVWKPLHLQPVFAACRMRGGRVAEDLFAQGLCLPSGSALTANDLNRIISIIRKLGAEPSATVAE
ncbi:MAG TPA: DegT/DnrJ/EryC1/StrS family aminotransferase, partial [Gemmataceae bacterium]|nr:DegT/DnrJ/EryC1/StrS family aminotransferase [Gemmataceae bacterium]